MTDFNLPFSGAVTQAFPWTNYFTINLGQSSNPEIEKEALSVASYGKQLGRIGDVVLVLLRHVDLGNMSHEEKAAVGDLKSMLHEIANTKAAHGARLVLRP
jgi:hypothetical protein